jgi:hypothetical protein
MFLFMGAIAINAAAYALVVRPLAVSSRGADTRAAVAAEAVRAAEREQASVEALISGKDRAQRELNAFYETILPGNLSEARQLTYARLPALARQTRVQYQRRRFDVEPMSREHRLGKLTVRMELAGEYDNLRRFIYEVERAPEFLIIDDVALTEQDAGQPLSLAITLSTYFRTGGNGF